MGTAKSTATAAQRIAGPQRGAYLPAKQEARLLFPLITVTAEVIREWTLRQTAAREYTPQPAGTVVSAGFDGAYGYSVVVDTR